MLRGGKDRGPVGEGEVDVGDVLGGGFPEHPPMQTGDPAHGEHGRRHLVGELHPRWLRCGTRRLVGCLVTGRPGGRGVGHCTRAGASLSSSLLPSSR